MEKSVLVSTFSDGRASEKSQLNPAHPRSYEAPDVAWEESLDEPTLAAACGKTNPGAGASCAASPAS